MQTMKKFQLGAGVVILNGLLSLTAMSPSVALANPCSPVVTCVPLTTCMSNGLAFCQQVAPAGCTPTSFTCFGHVPPCTFPPFASALQCQYN